MDTDGNVDATVGELTIPVTHHIFITWIPEKSSKYPYGHCGGCNVRHAVRQLLVQTLRTVLSRKK